MKLSNHNEVVIEKFAEMIISRMESMKASDWKQGWMNRLPAGAPVNIEGNSYKGCNSFFLTLDTVLQDWEYPIYCTMRQANRLGAHINKGSKAMPVIYWDYTVYSPDHQKMSREDYSRLSPEEKKKCMRFPFMKSYSVFNIEQTNLEQKQPEKVAALKDTFTDMPMPKDDEGMYKNEAIDKMIDNQTWLCRIQNNKVVEGAFYSPARDLVVIPKKEQFKLGKTPEDIYKDGMEYYSSLIHEMTHSTGTANRLNRKKGQRFGDADYAREELVAELTAARVGQTLGFDSRVLNNNAAYCDGWINAMRQSPKYVLNLMSDVDMASRLILEKIG